MIAIEDITVEPPASGESVDFSAMFGNTNPVELEIGCGKGGFLLRRAQQHPERNFLGLEWANPYFKFAVNRMARWGLFNVRIMRADAKHFVIHRLPAGCLSAIHVYHPDPWPKKRHHKRRLFTQDFVEAVERVLSPGGCMAVQTDHQEYFQQIKQVLAAAPTLEAIAFDESLYGEGHAGPGTNFEVKYEREGRTIYRIAVRRV